VVPEKQLRVKEYDESFEAATVMTVTEAKRLDARIKDREFNLQNKSYPPAEIVAKGAHRVIAGTDVVVKRERERDSRVPRGRDVCPLAEPIDRPGDGRLRPAVQLGRRRD
jgi:hypothetical protein